VFVLAFCDVVLSSTGRRAERDNSADTTSFDAEVCWGLGGRAGEGRAFAKDVAREALCWTALAGVFREDNSGE
jgi:hypothetical protein